jgi:hypothetical protein
MVYITATLWHILCLEIICSTIHAAPVVMSTGVGERATSDMEGKEKTPAHAVRVAARVLEKG